MLSEHVLFSPQLTGCTVLFSWGGSRLYCLLSFSHALSVRGCGAHVNGCSWDCGRKGGRGGTPEGGGGLLSAIESVVWSLLRPSHAQTLLTLLLKWLEKSSQTKARFFKRLQHQSCLS